ncbi:MAG: hypothetical protein ACE5DQ_02255 [Candidatus Paceibacterota bacterium]
MGIINDIREFLSGKKAYIVAALMFGVSVVKMSAGEINLDAVLQSDDLKLLLEALGLGAIRATASKILAKLELVVNG